MCSVGRRLAFCRKGCVVEPLWETLQSWWSQCTLACKGLTEALWEEETGLILFHLQSFHSLLDWSLSFPDYFWTSHKIIFKLNTLDLGPTKVLCMNLGLNKWWYLPCNKLVLYSFLTKFSRPYFFNVNFYKHLLVSFNGVIAVFGLSVIVVF